MQGGMERRWWWQEAQWGHVCVGKLVRTELVSSSCGGGWQQDPKTKALQMVIT